MSLAYLHSDNMEDVRERLENSVPNSSVDTMYDKEDCFITVTQRNETTGNESKWSFCVDFGDWRVTMLEPVEDMEYFGNDNEIFGIIKNFLNGGMSREKRFGNKIGSSRKPIKSDFNPYYEKHPDTPVGYLLGGPADTVTDADKKTADEYGIFYEGYGTMDGTEKGHLFIGEYQKLKSYFEDYMGHSLADDYIYPYEDSFGEHILDRFEVEMTWVLPTEKDYQDVVNRLNEYVDKE